MPTPIYSLRLSKKTQDDLSEMGKVYGLPNGRAFAREILEVMCSGDPAKVQAFNRRLMMAVGEQLALKLNEPLEAAIRIDAADKAKVPPAPKPPKKKKRGRRVPR